MLGTILIFFVALLATLGLKQSDSKDGSQHSPDDEQEQQRRAISNRTTHHGISTLFLMSAVSPEIAADFLIEAQEILDRLGEQLVTLEQDPSDTQQLNAVFRGFHTLKGGAGFLAIHAMVNLCHAAEEALGIVRAGKATLEPHHFDAAQQSLDYLQRMLDAVAASEEPPHAPASLIEQFDVHVAPVAKAISAPAPAAGADDLIDDDEFEALLDQLQGNGGKPAAPVAATRPPSGDLIDDDEFEALLDQLHGGAAPGAQTAAAPPPPRPAAPAVPSPTAKPAARATAEAEQTIRVDTKRLDAIVNMVGELVLSRNRLKTLRARLRDEELDRAVSSLDIATARLQSAVMRTRMQPVGKVFSRFPKVARDVARNPTPRFAAVTLPQRTTRS